MRRIISFLLISAFVLSLSSCSFETGETDSIVSNSAYSLTTIESEAPIERNLVVLDDYVRVEYDGYDFAGIARVSFDKEQFLLDHINDIAFNEENRRVYQELYGTDGRSAASAILDYVSVGLDKTSPLCNGDLVNTIWTIDTERVEDYFDWNYFCSSQSYTVAGLPEAETYDPFEEVMVSFSGTAPYGIVNIYAHDINRDYYGGIFEASPIDNLSNGDEVVVTYSCDDKSTMIERYKKYPNCFEKTYTVNGLDTYVQSLDKISEDAFEKLIDDARNPEFRTADAYYCGYFFYTAKDRPAHGVQFLEWCGLPVGNAICFVFEDGLDAGNYTVVALENLVFDESGELIYQKHEMYKMFQTYTQDNLIDSFVGVFDDIMDCTYDVNFE